jgi:hypothetical protein
MPVSNFQWDYIGQVELAKDYGVETIFRLRHPSVGAVVESSR